MTRQFLTAKDIQQITGQSYGWSQKVVSQLNNRLKADGYLTVRGSVPRAVFERSYGIAQKEERK